MAIYNFDRSQQYSNLDSSIDFRSDADQLNPAHSQYNHDSPDIAAAERLALESIRVSGAWVTVLPRTDDNKYDKVWMEDTDPTYFVGVDFKAHFKPEPPEVVLTKFGHDAPNGISLVFSRAEVLSLLGERIIRNGDIIVVPYNSLVTRAEQYQVTHVADTGNFRFRWLYLTVDCVPLNRDESTKPLNM